MTVQQAKEMDMVDYLSTLGYQPNKINGKNYWYLSPLHEEKTASGPCERPDLQGVPVLHLHHPHQGTALPELHVGNRCHGVTDVLHYVC